MLLVVHWAPHLQHDGQPIVHDQHNHRQPQEPAAQAWCAQLPAGCWRLGDGHLRVGCIVKLWLLEACSDRRACGRCGAWCLWRLVHVLQWRPQPGLHHRSPHTPC